MPRVKWILFSWNPKLSMDEQNRFIVKGDRVQLTNEEYAIYEVLEVCGDRLKIQHLNALTNGEVKDIHPSQVCMLLECGL